MLNQKFPHPLPWRHNEHDDASNHDCLLNRLFRRRSRKTSKLCVTGLCEGNSTVWPVNSPRKWPVTRKMFPFDDVIMSAKLPNGGSLVTLPHAPLMSSAAGSILSLLPLYCFPCVDSEIRRREVPTSSVTHKCHYHVGSIRVLERV